MLGQLNRLEFRPEAVGEPLARNHPSQDRSRPMRVLLANQPQILRESLALAIAAQREVEVKLETASASTILRTVCIYKPHVLTLSLRETCSNPRMCRVILARSPDTLILALGLKKITVYWWEETMQSCRLDCSFQSILDLLDGDLAGPNIVPCRGWRLRATKQHSQQTSQPEQNERDPDQDQNAVGAVPEYRTVASG
jgi:hypothetical protein